MRIEVLRRPKIRVHRALAVGRHQHVASPRRGPVRRRRGVEINSGRPDIMGKDLAEPVILDATDERRTRAEPRDTDNRVGGDPPEVSVAGPMAS